jgi:hypothetical protein
MIRSGTNLDNLIEGKFKEMSGNYLSSKEQKQKGPNQSRKLKESIRSRRYGEHMKYEKLMKGNIATCGEAMRGNLEMERWQDQKKPSFICPNDQRVIVKSDVLTY